MQEQFISEGLCLMEKTHTGAVLEKLQLIANLTLRGAKVVSVARIL